MDLQLNCQRGVISCSRPSPFVPVCVRIIMMLTLFLGSAFAYETVVLDPGHGGADEGTRWHGVSEKTLTLDVAKRVDSILRDHKVSTAMTRRSDKTVSLDDR